MYKLNFEYEQITQFKNMFVKYSLLLLLVLLLNSGLTQVVPNNHYIHKKPSFFKNEMISDTLYMIIMMWKTIKFD